MDRHKSLYKDNSTMLSPKVQRLNRERLAIRSKQRSDKFSSIRKISVSPSPLAKMNAVMEVANDAIDVNKENEVRTDLAEPKQLAPVAQEQANLSRGMVISRIALAARKTDHDKLTRQEKFLQRYIEWKDTKKQQEIIKKQQKHLQKKPFVPAGCAQNVAAAAENDVKSTPLETSSMVPKSQKFKAPEGLKNPLQETKPSKYETQRKSLYAVVPTPEKRKNDTKKFPIPRKALPSHHSTRPAHVFLPSRTARSEPIVVTAPNTNTHSKKTPVAQPNKATTATKCIDVQKPLLKSKTAKTAEPSTDSTCKPRRLIKPRPFILPPPPPPPRSSASGAIPKSKHIDARIAKPIRGGGGSEKMKSSGAVGKAKATAIVKDALKNKKPLTETIKGPKLAVSMKAKKAPVTKNSIVSNAAKKQPAKFKLNKNTLLAVVAQQNLPIAETPTDLFANANPFGMFVTSTKRKSLSNSQGTLEFLTLDTNICDTISPVEPLDSATKLQTTRKRQLLQPNLDQGDTAAKCINKTLEKNNRKNKFNFVRYSEAATETSVEDGISPLLEDEHQQKIEDKKAQPIFDPKQEKGVEETDKTICNEETLTNITPTRTPTNDADGERPINYLSPFVSVTRGKVNSKIEKEKRNSIYLQGIQNAENESIAKFEKEKQEALVETRRTMETVRYFRKQLSSETERLHGICDKWETYKTENLVYLQETGGDDMINVTIGQTKLLTTKKFKQFSGLIDRCERAVTAPESVVNDGSEDTKPITTVDLEGFWCMVGLQVDNVEKRFHNLERWRDNDWHDPEDVKPQKQPAKVKKVKSASNQATKAATKAKPSSGLQQMLRKMHADMRKNKAAAAAEATNNANNILTPSRKRISIVAKTVTPKRDSTPTRRISILVKDRKFHSASPTILTINTTPNRRSSYLRHRTDLPICEESPKMLNHVQELRRSMSNLRKSCHERNELWKAAINGADQQRRLSLVGTPTPSTPPPSTPPPSTPPPSKGRKSILKTPGTAKGKPKSVIFNEELRIKKYKFTIDSDHSDAENDSKLEKGEESRKMDGDTEEDKRTYRLRNRKIVLRPSSEFVIPS